ncbi:MAG: TolC family protein [Chlorobi bacterium]|nr:TolC family protein [Chlorobiota bacterium]
MRYYLLIIWLLIQSAFAQQNDLIKYVDSLLATHPAILSSYLSSEAIQLSSKAVTPLSISPFYSHEEWGNGAQGIVSYGIRTGDINPWEWKAEKDFLKTQSQTAGLNLQITKASLLRDILTLYARWSISKERLAKWSELKHYLDSLYLIASRSYQIGQIDIIQLKELEIQIQQTKSRIINIEQQAEGLKQSLKTILKTDSLPVFSNSQLPEPDSTLSQSNPLLQQQRIKAYLQALELKRRTASFMPSLFAGYSLQTIEGTAGFKAIEIGISIPLNAPGALKQQKAYKKQLEASQTATEAFSISLNTQIQQLYAQWQATSHAIALYTTHINQATQKLMETYQSQLRAGAISPMEFIISYRNIVNLNDEFFTLREQEATLRIQLLFLTGKLTKLIEK